MDHNGSVISRVSWMPVWTVGISPFTKTLVTTAWPNSKGEQWEDTGVQQCIIYLLKVVKLNIPACFVQSLPQFLVPKQKKIKNINALGCTRWHINTFHQVSDLQNFLGLTIGNCEFCNKLIFCASEIYFYIQQTTGFMETQAHIQSTKRLFRAFLAAVDYAKQKVHNKVQI